ncbi:hypothetical protein CO181_03545 [candidate division WWE3 bacterium CG_4_9_14_3_um_filter_43_9]|uniref:Anti-sigma K factor RskA C-terminal domain-containing protein n=1 Tax=candidate division WWE3 bacterium CG_4_9_14_3_um_filter_43_9 TaxID=1975082 RepID=A0A2M7WWM4_UNCKA|nr:MAG: hypothetical protein CO181_03545 [candidate division WWE3 bacterium CG_4_9_14_3_um_filter_43_9]
MTKRVAKLILAGFFLLIAEIFLLLKMGLIGVNFLDLSRLNSVLGTGSQNNKKITLKAREIAQYFPANPQGEVEITTSFRKTTFQIQIRNLEKFTLGPKQFYQVWIVDKDLKHPRSLGKLEFKDGVYQLRATISGDSGQFQDMRITLQDGDETTPGITLFEAAI